MARTTLPQVLDVSREEKESSDVRWLDLYRAGGWSCFILAATIVLAIVAYLIWPYTPGFTSLEAILTTLHENRLSGLMSLDLMMVLMGPLTIIPYPGPRGNPFISPNSSTNAVEDLQIGAGTGYNAPLIASTVGPSGNKELGDRRDDDGRAGAQFLRPGYSSTAARRSNDRPARGAGCQGRSSRPRTLPGLRGLGGPLRAMQEIALFEAEGTAALMLPTAR